MVLYTVAFLWLDQVLIALEHLHSVDIIYRDFEQFAPVVRGVEAHGILALPD